MTWGPIVGAFVALAAVLGVFALAVRGLNRLTRFARADAGLPLEVVARLGLGPRQGLAVVRIGERAVVVSVGEGGIRPVLELSAEEAMALGATTRRGAIATIRAVSSESGDAEVEGLEPRKAVSAGREGGAAAGRNGWATAGREGWTAVWDRVRREPFDRLRERLRAGLIVVAAAGALGAVAPVSAQGATPESAAFETLALTPANAMTPASAHAVSPATVALAGAPLLVAQAAQASGAAGGAAIDSAAASMLPPLNLTLGDADEPTLRLTGTVGTVVVIGLLTLLPTLLLLMTSFTRILVVLQFLKQALGTQSAPPGHLLTALALLLTGFVMAPTMGEVNANALQPWIEGELEEGEMLQAAVVPLREFMLSQTSERELAVFLEMSESPPLESADEIPLVVLVSAFAISELRTAFQIGFALFLPFVVIDLVVASVLTSMGMFMLPPMMVALPLKMMLFVLVDGWSLVVQGIVSSFV